MVSSDFSAAGLVAPGVAVSAATGGKIVAPASFTQERLWFVSRYYAGSPAYNSGVGLHLHGPLDVPMLELALNEVRRRHCVLRATFAQTDHGLMQVVAPFEPTPLPLADYRHHPSRERQRLADELAHDVVRRPFDLDHGPLMIAELALMDETEHLLAMAFHHTVFDGWSRTVMLDDLAEFYAALVENREPDLPPLTRQYHDYATWQRQQFHGGLFDDLLEFWRKELDGVVPLELPTDYPRGAVRTTSGELARKLLPADLTAQIKAFARSQRCTLYTFLVSAMQALLHRHTDQDDLTIGFPAAGRTHVEFENLIGPFINTLVLRADLSGDPVFSEFLSRQRRRVLEAIGHQGMPFERLVHELGVSRTMSHPPLFQVLMQLRNYAGGDLDKGGLHWTPVRTFRHAAQFDLSFSGHEAPEGLQLNVEYNSDLFKAQTVNGWFDHYEILLRGILAHPHSRISRLPVMSAAERVQLLVGWNRTETGYPQEACLHDLFLAQARRVPDKPAVVSGTSRLTYRELDEQSEMLARHLLARDCGNGARVGIYVERSPDIPVAFVGIMRAGAACVPLDPNYPLQRTQLMASDAGVSLIVASDGLAERLAELPQPVLRMSEARQPLVDSGPLPPVNPESIAYITYTSGSTGRPKAVPVPHAGCVSLLSNSRDVYTEQAAAGALMSFSIAFDASVRSIYVPLIAGGCLIILDGLLDLVSRTPPAPVTLMSIVPSAMAELLRHGRLPDSLDTVIFIGEPLPAELVRRVYEAGHVRRVFNQYGPTETTWYCLQSPVERGVTDPPPLGRPVANMKMYVLDKYGNPAPQGTHGELYIGGLGVTEGYLNRPELTRERFLPDPFAGDPKARMYRTGDLVRYDDEGRLHFLGRTDFQVKIRGCRVELPEVEAALEQHPAVSRAVVVAQAETPESLRLVGYVAAPDTAGLAPADLRSHLGGLVPEYMIPSLIMILPALPLKPNGKVDRQALPEPQVTVSDLEDAVPASDLERQLLQFWSETLGLPRIGLDDSFFDLGGHSLLAARLFATMREQAGLEPPLTLLFQAPTVRQFARAVAAAEA